MFPEKQCIINLCVNKANAYKANAYQMHKRKSVSKHVYKKIPYVFYDFSNTPDNLLDILCSLCVFVIYLQVGLQKYSSVM